MEKIWKGISAVFGLFLILALAKSPYILDNFPAIKKILFYEETSPHNLSVVRPEPAPARLPPPDPFRTVLKPASPPSPASINQAVPPKPPQPKIEWTQKPPAPAQPARIARNAYFRPPAACEHLRDNFDALVACTNRLYDIQN